MACRRSRTTFEKAPIFGIENSWDFLTKLQEDFADEPGSGRLAPNCALTAHHMRDWVWSDWLKNDKRLQGALQFSDPEGFHRWLHENCVGLAWMEELANGTKHCTRNKSFNALRVSRLPFAFDTQDAGFDKGAWDGTMPFLTGEPTFLLIDNGPEALEHQWMPGGQLLDAVVRFWKAFFRNTPRPVEAYDGRLAVLEK